MTHRFDGLAALRDWASAARPVFICGQERSGTSALLLALARHPALFAVPDVFETFIFHQPRALLSDPPRPMQQGYLRGPESLAALRAQLATLGGGDATTLADDDLIRAFFAFAASAVYADRRPLEKTPAHVHSLPTLFRLFPQARVLACVRDPVEVVESYRQRLAREQALGKPRTSWGWLDLPDAMLIPQFRKVDKSLRLSLNFAAGQVFMVPYAWLTADPASALAAICDFLGEPFDAAVLTPKPTKRPRVDERLSAPLGAAAATAATRLLSPGAAATIHRETPGLTRRWKLPGVIGPEML